MMKTNETKYVTMALKDAADGIANLEIPLESKTLGSSTRHKIEGAQVQFKNAARLLAAALAGDQG